LKACVKTVEGIECGLRFIRGQQNIVTNLLLVRDTWQRKDFLNFLAIFGDDAQTIEAYIIEKLQDFYQLRKTELETKLNEIHFPIEVPVTEE
jgi:hypothetical protein